MTEKDAIKFMVKVIKISQILISIISLIGGILIHSVLFAGFGLGYLTAQFIIYFVYYDTKIHLEKKAVKLTPSKFIKYISLNETDIERIEKATVLTK